jgi:hypothetical protein
VVFFVMTWQRCSIWRDNYSLWSAASQKYPRSVEALNNRGLGCLESGQTAEAAAIFRLVEELRSRN